MEEEEEGVRSSWTPPPKHKVLKEQRNRCRKPQQLGGEAQSFQHVVQVEINAVRSAREGASRRRRKAGAAAPPDPPTVSASPSQLSVLSDSAAEELHHLRNYYSRQLKRIDYISHECLGPPAQPGVLACIREPLRSLRLPRGGAVVQTARSLWTRMSSRRKLLHR